MQYQSDWYWSASGIDSIGNRCGTSLIGTGLWLEPIASGTDPHLKLVLHPGPLLIRFSLIHVLYQSYRLVLVLVLDAALVYEISLHALTFTALLRCIPMKDLVS